jgi:hypothetical protein
MTTTHELTPVATPTTADGDARDRYVAKASDWDVGLAYVVDTADRSIWCFFQDRSALAMAKLTAAALNAHAAKAVAK